MVSFINSWVQGIVIAIVISTIIEMILPKGNIKKYVRTVMGAYTVFVIISPIFTKITGQEFNLNSLKMPEVKEYEETTIDTNAYIENTYINKIKQDIIENIEQKGYKVEIIIIEIEKEEENYGNINEIQLKLTKQDTEKSNIAPIEIDINNESKEEKTISNEEIQELKEFLQETYGAEDISINE